MRNAATRLPQLLVVASLVVLWLPAPAAQRTFVRSDGADANPCTLSDAARAARCAGSP